jgi:hypothetical protein
MSFRQGGTICQRKTLLFTFVMLGLVFVSYI